jgi:hypothetical protein
MPTTDELDSPLKRTEFSGPGVEAHERRKESNNNAPVKAEELRASFEKVKNGLLAGVKALINAPRN